MKEPREESPRRPAERPEEDVPAGETGEAHVEKRPDYKGQDLEGGSPQPEYDMYRDIPGEWSGG